MHINTSQYSNLKRFEVIQKGSAVRGVPMNFSIFWQWNMVKWQEFHEWKWISQIHLDPPMGYFPYKIELFSAPTNGRTFQWICLGLWVISPSGMINSRWCHWRPGCARCLLRCLASLLDFEAGLRPSVVWGVEAWLFVNVVVVDSRKVIDCYCWGPVAKW